MRFCSEEEYRPFPNRKGRNARQAQLEVPLFARVLHLPRSASILEIGCGRGIALPVLQEICAPRQLVGIDVDMGALREAKRNGVVPLLVQCDLREMPFPDCSFDIVIDFGTCYHISRPTTALSEIARVLQPAGAFCTETKLSQLLSHPVRSFRRTLRWKEVTAFRLERYALFWMRLEKLPKDDGSEIVSQGLGRVAQS